MNTIPVRLPTKRARVLLALLQHERINRFQLEQVARDHVPNSTISELRASGLEIESTLVEVPGFGGAVARIAEYRLARSSRDLAAELLQRASHRGRP